MSAIPSPSAPAGSRRGSWPPPTLGYLPPILIGLVLRLQGLRDQVLGGDELHALQIALGRSLPRILAHYSSEVDHSIPLTAFYRLLIDLGCRPSETVLRVPGLIAGVLLLWTLPRACAAAVGARVAIVCAWLLALSPLLVLYSRIARSYMPMLFCAFVAVLAFYRWTMERRRGQALLYVLCSALAVYFHLVCAAFVLAPFVFAGLALLARRRAPPLRAVAALALVTVLAIGALFFPAREDLLAFVQGKTASGALSWTTVLKTARLHSGSFSPVVTVLFCALASVGAVLLARANRRFFLYLACLGLCHVAALSWARPEMVEHALAFSRYALVLLPIVLLLIAAALGSPWPARFRGGRALAGITSALGIGLWFLSGPLGPGKFWTSSFVHHNLFLDFVAEDFRLRAGASVPEIYARVRDDDEVDALIEFPVDWRWRHCTAPYLLQDVHRKAVLVSTELALYRDRRLALRNSLPPTPEAYLASRADLLIVHLDAGALERSFRPRAEKDAELWRQSAENAAQLVELLRRRWGPPSFADANLVTWDLAALRRAAD